MSSINFKKCEISAHNNWNIIEEMLIKKIKSPKSLIFISFCEMYFYKNGKALKSDWCGIIHDPEDTNKYYEKKNILKNENFMKSLSFCKGLFTMSKNVNNWIIKELNPNFFVKFVYHPLSFKNLKDWNLEEFVKKGNIYQIGNWLRKTYSIYKLKAKKKNIVPFNERTKKELLYFLDKDKVILDEKEIESVKEIKYLDDKKYNEIFSNSIIFLNLYSSTCNNVIVECLKSNCPLLINKHKSIEDYLGENYPFFYENISEANQKINDLELIKKTNKYLIDLDKSKFDIKNLIDCINSSLNLIYV